MEASPHFSEQLPRLARVISLRSVSAEQAPLNYDYAHGSVEVPHVEEPVKYTISVPHEVSDPDIHIFVPGFGGFKRSSRKMRNALADHEGIAAVSFEPVRNAGFYHDLLKAQKAHIDTIEAIAQDLPYNKQLQELSSSCHLSMQKLALLPHSMGGLAAARHAHRHSEEVSRVILIATVGMEGPVMLGFIPRLPNSAKKELLPPIINGQFGGIKDALHMGKKAWQYYSSSPARTIGEMYSCMSGDIRPKIADLGALGVRTAMYYFENDVLIPAQSSIDASGHLVDYAEIAPGMDHLAPQLRAGQVAADIARITHKLASPQLELLSAA